MSNLLSLDEATAYATWREQFRASEAQAARLRSIPLPEDRWGQEVPVRRFGPDETPQGLAALFDLIPAESTILDIGAGAGRHSVPMARHFAHVTAVDPSPGMTRTLEVHAAGIHNLDVLQATSWPPARDDDVPMVDTAFNFHVVYFVEEIGPFLEAMERVATQRCVIVAGDRAGTHQNLPRGAFQAAHEEPVIDVPAARELVAVLGARGAAYEMRRIPSESWSLDYDPLTVLRNVCLVEPGTPADERLLAWVARHGVPEHEETREQALISWAPNR